MPNPTKPPEILEYPFYRDLTTAEIIEELCLNGGVDKDSAVYILSIKESMDKYRNSNLFEVVRNAFPPGILVSYSGDVDSIYSLLESHVDEQDDQTDEEKAYVEKQMNAGLDLALFDWNEQFMSEINPQLRKLNLNYSREVCGGSLASGDRLVFSAPLYIK